MLNGVLITNKYLQGEKFDILKERFVSNAKDLDIELSNIDNVRANNIFSNDSNEKYDFVLFYDKDIKLAELIEKKGIRVYNNSEAIRVCDDKALTYIRLLSKGIKQPKTFFSPFYYNKVDVSKNKYSIDYIEDNFSYPFIIKECFGSFGAQVYLINDRERLMQKLSELSDKEYIIQELIKSSYGRDIRVQVVGGNVVCCMYRESDNDFRANATLGGHIENYVVNDLQCNMAVDVCKILNLDFAGVDILFGEDDKPILCEVNSNAHIENISNVTGINVYRKILQFIKDDIKK